MCTKELAATQTRPLTTIHVRTYCPKQAYISLKVLTPNCDNSVVTWFLILYHLGQYYLHLSYARTTSEPLLMTVRCYYTTQWKALKCQTLSAAVHVIVLVCWLEIDHCLVTLMLAMCIVLFLPMQSSFTSFWRSFTGLVQLIFSFPSWLAVPTGKALASQQSIFRENRLKFSTFICRWEG